VVGEAKRHGNSLGIQISEDTDGTIRFSFNDGPKYPLLHGLTDVERRLAMMDEGKIVLAVLDPSTQLMGYDLKREQAESWCRLYNECVKEFLKKYPDRFTAMAAVPIQEPERAARVLEHAVTQLDFRAANPGKRCVLGCARFVREPVRNNSKYLGVSALFSPNCSGFFVDICGSSRQYSSLNQRVFAHCPTMMWPAPASH
jgi:hypothetical protein